VLFLRLVYFPAFLSLLAGCVMSDPAFPLTSEDCQKITELVLAVAEDPEETVKTSREELWTILNKHGSPTEKQIDRLKIRFRRIAEGHHLFWLDAREALKSHRRVKSPARAQWEEQLEKDGWLSAGQRAGSITS